MSWWFDLAVLIVFVLLLAIMPWKRPHPNHVFALDMLKLLADEESGVSGNPGLSEPHKQTEGSH